MENLSISKETKELEKGLKKMIDNIEKFSKEDINKIQNSISDLLKLAEEAKRKHEKVEVTT